MSKKYFQTSCCKKTYSAFTEECAPPIATFNRKVLDLSLLIKSKTVGRVDRGRHSVSYRFTALTDSAF